MAESGFKSARRWLTEIERAEKRDSKWVQRGRKIITRYRDERNDSSDGIQGRRRFNMLWSNIQTLLPSLYARRPDAVCERRFLDHDPVGRVAATILERDIRYEIEENGFHESVTGAVLDYLLVGRGQVWVRFEPGNGGEAASPEQEGESAYDQAGNSPDQSATADGPLDAGSPGGGAGSGVAGTGVPVDTAGMGAGSYLPANGSSEDGMDAEPECVPVDYVNWEDFLTSQARVWSEVTWVARRVYMGKTEMAERAKATGNNLWKDVPVERPRDIYGRFVRAAEGEETSKAEIFEIWCKETKAVHFVAKGFDQVIEEVPDPLQLRDFWPCPKPLYATQTHDTLTPVPDYAEYQDQAEELDQLTNRLASLARSMKVVGAYDASATGLARILDEGMENKLVPVNNWAAFAEKGGMDGAISWVPIKDVAAVMLQLYEAREKVKADLYEITGIADIIRGQSDPRETLGAQQLKGNFATQRLAMRQAEVARFARDIIRIVGEIIAEHWSPQQMVLASSIMQDEGVIAEETSSPEQPQNPMIGHNGGPPMGPTPLAPPPGPGVAVTNSAPVPMGGIGGGAPTPGAGLNVSAAAGSMPAPGVPPEVQKMQIIAQAIAMLRNDKMRGFRIDIETDSTIQPDAQQEKAARTEFLTGMATLLQQAIAGAATFPPVMSLAGKALQWGARGFRVGRDMESAIDEFLSEAAKFVGAPPDPNQNAKNQADAVKLQADGEKAKAEIIKAQIDAQTAQQQAQMDQQAKLLEAQLKQAELQAKLDQIRMDSERSQQEHVQKMAEITLQAEVAREQAAAKKAQAKGGMQ